MNSETGIILFILLHWNDTEQLINTFEGINKLGLEKQLLVIDNNFSKGSKNKLKAEIPEDNIIWNNNNLGFGPAINVGLEWALTQAEISHICLLNNDIEFDESEIEKFLIESMQDLSKVAWAPIVLENSIKTFGGKDISSNLNTRIQENENEELAYLPGTFVLFNKKVFHRIGVLEEQYFFGGEMADFCHRIASANMEIGINQNYSVKHFSNSDTILKRYYSIRNRFLYIKKFHPKNYKLISINVLRICRMTLGSILKLEFSNFRLITKALFHGLSNTGGELKMNK